MAAAPEKKRGRPRDESSLARRREEILETAAKVFAARGYQSADMQEIADGLGLGKGTLYRYFASKEELFLAAADRAVQRLTETVDRFLLVAELAPLERLAEALRAYLTFFQDRPHYVELLVQERAEFRDRKTHTYFQHRASGRDAWEEMFRQLIAEGRVRDVPVSRIMDVLSDLLYGTMFTNHLSGRHKPLEVQAQDVLDIVFHGILAGPCDRGTSPAED